MIFEGIDDDIHSSVEQIKRFEKAATKKFNILEFNADEQIALFEGSDGSIYSSSLQGCTCIDCAFRRLPCKHMYKLAIDCGIIDENIEPWKTYKGYSKLLNKVKKHLNDFELNELKEVEKYIVNYKNERKK